MRERVDSATGAVQAVREVRTYWRVQPVGFAPCIFETREQADEEAATLRAEGDEVRVEPVRMDPQAFERLPEFGGY